MVVKSTVRFLIHVLNPFSQKSDFNIIYYYSMEIFVLPVYAFISYFPGVPVRVVQVRG